MEQKTANDLQTIIGSIDDLIALLEEWVTASRADGHAGTGDGHAGTGDGHPGPSDGHAGTGDGHPGTGDSQAGAGDGHAGTGDGFIATGDLRELAADLMIANRIAAGLIGLLCSAAKGDSAPNSDSAPSGLQSPIVFGHCGTGDCPDDVPFAIAVLKMLRASLGQAG